MGSRVSVLIPVYNRRELVTEAIRSALTQDIDGLDVVVVDNSSDDGTWELLNELSDNRLRIFRNDKNLGLFGNFDRCGDLACGEFSLFLCSDDRLAPGILRRGVSQMESEPNTVLLSTSGRVIDEKGRSHQIIARGFPPGRYDGRSLIPAWFWTHFNYGANPLNYPSGVIFRTAPLKACLPFRSHLRTIADIDMYFRVARLGDMRIWRDVGCFVMHHTGQIGRVARASGELIRNELALLAEHRTELESVGVYEAIERQMSTSALASVLHLARTDWRAALGLHRTLNRNFAQMVAAALKSVAYIGAEKLTGYRRSPYLKSVSAR